jgi:HD-like signal output (HDOD) protein
MTQHLPHAGIELDRIDLSQVSGIPLPKTAPAVSAKPIDTKDFIRSVYKKIAENDSFLSFSVQVEDVNRILQTKYSSAGDIAKVILKDVALTTKLLKLVNSSFYGHFSKKGIQTISEAMIILGTEEIKLAAASLKLYEFMQDIATVKILKTKALKSLQRSLIARQIANDEAVAEAEAIQISAMLYDFGEYLVALFSPQVFIQVQIMAEDDSISREQASKAVIGVSYNAIGRFIAQKWQMPDSIILSMKPVEDFNIPRIKLTREQVLQYICAFSNELCDIEISMQGRYIGDKIMQVCEKYKKCLDIPAPAAVHLLKMSWQNIQKHAAILGISLDNTR